MMFSHIASLLFLTFANPSWAQEALSFRQCVELAQKNNADLQAAEGTLQAKSYLINSNRSTYFPQVTGSVSYLRSGTETFLAEGRAGTYSATLSATQNIFNGFSDSAKVTQAQAQARSSEAALQVAKAKVSYELKAAFANLLYAKEAEKINREFQKRREDNLRMVELRFEGGRENKGSLLLSRAYLMQAKVEVLKARHVRETSQSDLRKVLGFDDERELDIQDDIPMLPPADSSPDFKSLALTTPQRRQSLFDVEASEATLQISKSTFFPSLNVTGSLGKSGDDFFPESDRWSVGATLSWPLFNGGKDYYATKSSVSNLYTAKRNLRGVERQLLASLRKSYTSYVEATQDMQVSEAFWVAAKSRAEIARSKYNNGLLTFDEWDIIENDLISKTKIYLQAKRDRIITEAAWEQAQGVGVFE